MRLILSILSISASLSQAADLKPLLAQPDQVVMQDDFSKPGPFNRQHWGARQGTQWIVEDGVLRGRPSTPEFQAKKKDHFGYEPRISAPVTPPQFIAQFSVRFTGGSETAIVPFMEFGHHVCRVRLTKDGAEVLADGEALKVAESKELKFEPGKWYHALAEMKGDEFVIQFADGPTLYAKHAGFSKPAEKGGSGLGIAGPKDGMAEIDNVTFWSIKPEAQPGWAAKRDSLPAFTPLSVGKKKAKGK
jgi:hypothetical protein